MEERDSDPLQLSVNLLMTFKQQIKCKLLYNQQKNQTLQMIADHINSEDKSVQFKALQTLYDLQQVDTFSAVDLTNREIHKILLDKTISSSNEDFKAASCEILLDIVQDNRANQSSKEVISNIFSFCQAILRKKDSNILQLIIDILTQSIWQNELYCADILNTSIPALVNESIKIIPEEEYMNKCMILLAEMGYRGFNNRNSDHIIHVIGIICNNLLEFKVKDKQVINFSCLALKTHLNQLKVRQIIYETKIYEFFFQNLEKQDVNIQILKFFQQFANFFANLLEKTKSFCEILVSTFIKLISSPQKAIRQSVYSFFENICSNQAGITYLMGREGLFHTLLSLGSRETWVNRLLITNMFLKIVESDFGNEFIMKMQREIVRNYFQILSLKLVNTRLLNKSLMLFLKILQKGRKINGLKPFIKAVRLQKGPIILHKLLTRNWPCQLICGVYTMLAECIIHESIEK